MSKNCKKKCGDIRKRIGDIRTQRDKRASAHWQQQLISVDSEEKAERSLPWLSGYTAAAWGVGLVVCEVPAAPVTLLRFQSLWWYL